MSTRIRVLENITIKNRLKTISLNFASFKITLNFRNFLNLLKNFFHKFFKIYMLYRSNKISLINQKFVNERLNLIKIKVKTSKLKEEIKPRPKTRGKLFMFQVQLQNDYKCF